jgi:parallel beta-helix repeat protein
MVLQLSWNNILLNNTVEDNLAQGGILLIGSGNSTLRNNTMNGNSINFAVTSGPTAVYPVYDNDIDVSNTVDGKPIYYWINQFNRTVPSNAGLAFLVNCSGIAVRNMNLSSNMVAIGLLNTNESSVENVYIHSCFVGIAAMSSHNNVLSNCTITNGVPLFFTPVGMLAVDCYNTTIRGNTISNMTGFWQYPQPSYGTGLMLYGNGNRIFLNNFINNTVQVATQDISNNTWDNGYPSGGNYWSDYTGIDADGDGIGDTTYFIDSNSQDDYPLMSPWAAPDFAVTNVIPSKTAVGQGYSATINVSVTNQGNKIEGYNLTVYANSTKVKTEYLTLKGGSNVTLAFLWNTTSLAKGNYTITAVLEALAEEADTSDNSLTDGTVYVGVSGDVDGNHWVNMLDLYYVALNFGKTAPYATLQIANCDIDDNGIINMLDLYIAATHFGQTDP